jgi:hypothetical protein
MRESLAQRPEANTMHLNDEENEQRPDEEDDDEDPEDDDDEDPDDWVTCRKCEDRVEKNSFITKYMNRGRMTAATFVCPPCTAEADADRRDRKAAKAAGGK